MLKFITDGDLRGHYILVQDTLGTGMLGGGTHVLKSTFTLQWPVSSAPQDLHTTHTPGSTPHVSQCSPAKILKPSICDCWSKDGKTSNTEFPSMIRRNTGFLDLTETVTYVKIHAFSVVHTNKNSLINNLCQDTCFFSGSYKQEFTDQKSKISG